MPAENRENPFLKKGNSNAFFREKCLTKNIYAAKEKGDQKLNNPTGSHDTGHGSLHRTTGSRQRIPWLYSRRLGGSATAEYSVLDVYFYAVIVGMCNMLLMLICKVSIVDFINSYIKSIVIPISGESWWFVTAYVFLLILADKINFIIGGLSKKQFTVVVLFFFVIYLVFSQTLSPFWNIERAIFYYLLGIYLKMDILKCKTGGGCLLAFGLSWLIKVFINYEIISFSVGDHAVNKLLFYAMCIIQEHICSTICVIMLFMFFLKKRELYIKFVNLIAKSTLFVYMLHDNDIVRKTFWNKLFANSSCLLTDKYFVIHVVGYSLIVYLICVLVWLVCDKLFYTSYLKLVGVINKLFKGMA